ncbi:DUF1836 domain-containing protein [Cytobacillus spongiae]|uniref:DUF1836 domain-containing protein n=1 Tax=Cytobacillus spongiae TaxID=2901381 RepID=UPI001F2A82E2|nr:DUF1836 domain-containing protein [Cytobacillus spongiae]UII54347.1 DUF1836 domain-containing protein [Cytobacillus spongiae]
MDKMAQLIEELELEKQISLEEIPQIDLYMDQIIQLFENKFSSWKRSEDDKVLTKTMINNYAKGKLLIPIKNKKYSKEHLILISLIYQLKGVLSINDIKETLSGINGRLLEETLDLEQFYQSYLNIMDDNQAHFTEEVEKKVEEMKNRSDMDPELEYILLISSFVNMSHMYRRVAEKLIDQLADKD